MSGGNETRSGAGHDEAYRPPAHDSDVAAVSHDQLRQRGKLWVKAMIAAFALGIATNMIVAANNTVGYLLSFRIEHAVRECSASLVLVLLLLLVHGGRNWARWVVAVWLLAAVVAIAYLELRHPRFELEGVIRKGVGLWALGMLLFSPSIQALVTPPPRRFPD